MNQWKSFRLFCSVWWKRRPDSNEVKMSCTRYKPFMIQPERLPNGYSSWLLNPLARKSRVQTPVLELNWSELEVVVAWEGGHCVLQCVGRGPPSCLVWTTCTVSRLRLDGRTKENWPKQHYMHCQHQEKHLVHSWLWMFIVKGIDIALATHCTI